MPLHEKDSVKKSDRPPAIEFTDSELWDDICRGNESAWRALVERHASLVYGVCAYVGLNHADSADCFQQTWILLYNNRRRIKDASRLSSWLVTTAKREAIRLRRKNARSFEPLAAESVDAAPIPDEQILEVEKQHQLELALSRLDGSCQQVLDEFFFADSKKSYKEIAASLGYSPNTLGAKRRRCLEKLKEILVQNGYWDERN